MSRQWAAVQLDMHSSCVHACIASADIAFVTPFPKNVGAGHVQQHMYTRAELWRAICDHVSWVWAGDALRPFLLHAFGGMYLDLDVQCFRPSDPWLAGADLVLQSEYKEQRDVVNSVMASVPGHPFWKLIIHQMLSVRAP